VLEIIKNILTKIDCNDIMLLPLVEGSFFVRFFRILNNPGREVLAKAKIHGSRARNHRRGRKREVRSLSHAASANSGIMTQRKTKKMIRTDLK